MGQPQFWEDPEAAKKILQQKNMLQKWTSPFQDMEQRIYNLKELYPEVVATQEEDLMQELEQEVGRLQQKMEEMELQKMLSSELDGKDCFFSIHAGAGGTESCDWVAMLSRMYVRWIQKKGWKIHIVDRLEGEVAGIKSITYRVEGDFAYGYCKSERGVHRLVRISPFDSGARRHTSFASVEIVPIIEEAAVEIRPEEIQIDTFRASGAGGQHVNKTDSAVRMTHIPTGIVVSCQNERSQIQNRETCYSLLRAKLYEKERQEKEEKLKQISGEKRQNAWGSQIRSYVFHPYTLVKDMRTKVEVGNIQAVMDGEIDLFVKAYLKEFS